jgi:hypothetical protein
MDTKSMTIKQLEDFMRHDIPDFIELDDDEAKQLGEVLIEWSKR